MDIAEALETGRNQLKAANIENALRDVQLLLASTIDRDSVFLIAHPEYELTKDETIQFNSFLIRREKREPIQYIVGKQDFYGLEFEVTPDVLIPRPETEVLVEAAIERFAGQKNVRFLEIGVGSGCISVAILKNLKQASAIGVDISNAALEIAGRNARKHQVSGRLTLINSDVYSNLNQTGFDLIVSNPPYIPIGDIEGLQIEVRDFEPRSALEGGIDGLDIVRRIIGGSPGHLSFGGNLMIEIGSGQSEIVRRSFDESTWRNVRFLSDLQGIERIVSAELS